MSGRQYCGEKEDRGKRKMIVVLLWLECWEKAWAHTDAETWPLCTDAKLNLRDRGWDEVEKEERYCSARPRGPQESNTLKLGVPTLGWGEGFGEGFDSSASRAALLMRIKVFAGPEFLQSRGHLASGGLILCLSLWNEECFLKELASPFCWWF